MDFVDFKERNNLGILHKPGRTEEALRPYMEALQNLEYREFAKFDSDRFAAGVERFPRLIDDLSQ